jgi:hypothetical protein
VALLHSIAQRTGKVIHLGLEPEPDGLIENTEELLAFFNQFLIPRGAKQLQTQLGTPLATAERLLYQHIKVCYDTCHFAVAFESPQEALGRLTQASIGISKIQLSSAIEVEIPQAQTDRRLLQTRLQPFAESTYLHQVVAQHHDGRLQRYRDLDQALPHLLNTQAQRWRTHFHVPIFLEDYGGLKSTQTHLIETLTYIWKLKPTPGMSYPRICSWISIRRSSANTAGSSNSLKPIAIDSAILHVLLIKGNYHGQNCCH